MTEAARIKLTPVEMNLASMTGCLRQICALRDGRPDAAGLDADKDGWGLHIEGAAGEMAAAKALGLYWEAPVNTFKKGGDVGHLQVRTRSKHDYDLLVRASDRDDDVFVLVTGRCPDFLVHGWITGRDAKQEKFAQDYGNRPKAYFVTKDNLRPLQELRRSATA